MKKFLEQLIHEAKAEGAEVHVVQVNVDESQDEPEPKNDFLVKAKKEAAEIAQLNRILYEAHIKAGFTSEEAISLVVAQYN